MIVRVGARVSKSDSSGSNTYLRASAGLIGAIVSDSGAAYTPGVSEKRGATSTFYHADIKNSVEQTSTSQSVVASKQYDAFGNEVSSQGPWQGPFQYGGAFGYHTDSDYGLKHLGARYYDSTTGRFLSRDPIKDGRNWYAYCESAPVGLFDANGLEPMAAAASAAINTARVGSRFARFGGTAGWVILAAVVVGVAVYTYVNERNRSEANERARDATRRTPPPRGGRPIFRVVEEPEIAALHAAGGVPPHRRIKPFTSHFGQRIRTQRSTRRSSSPDSESRGLRYGCGPIPSG